VGANQSLSSKMHNGHHGPRQVEYPPKLGDLLVTMHITPVKILRVFVLKKNHNKERNEVS